MQSLYLVLISLFTVLIFSNKACFSSIFFLILLLYALSPASSAASSVKSLFFSSSSFLLFSLHSESSLIMPSDNFLTLIISFRINSLIFFISISVASSILSELIISAFSKKLSPAFIECSEYLQSEISGICLILIIKLSRVLVISSKEISSRFFSFLS